MKKLMMTTALALGLACSPISEAHATSAYAEMPAGVYMLDKTHAQLVWRVSHLGLSNYTARFTQFDAELTFNPEKPEQSTLVATVNPLSVATDYPHPEKTDFDAEISKGEQWLNGEKFSEIRFESKSIKRTGEDAGIMTGDLTFLGVTKPMTLNVRFNGAMAEQPFSKLPTLGFSATGTLKRSDWGLDTYVPNIGDEVQLLIEAEFAKAQ